MENFVFFTDSHLRLTPTVRRTDNLFAAQLQKLEWVGKRAKELGSQFVVCGGDIGDAWDWKISMINKVVDVFKQYPVKCYTVLGNHDVPGRNPALWQDTGVGLLHSMGVITVLNPPPEKLIAFNPPKSSFSLFAFHSDQPRTKTLIENTFKEKIPGEKYKVAIVHAPVGLQASPWCVGHKELTLEQFDVALFGDIHPGWPPYLNPKGVKVCNPGSLSRLSKTDMLRKPQIVVVYADGTIVQEEVPHSATEDCFDTSGIDAEKQEIGKGFLAAIAARQLVEDIDPKEYVQKIGTAAGYSEAAIETLSNEL